MCCIYCVVLLTKSRSTVNMIAWCSYTLTHFDRQFLFIFGSLKNDVLTPVSHIKLQTSIMQKWPTILLIYKAELCYITTLSGTLKPPVRLFEFTQNLDLETILKRFGLNGCLKVSYFLTVLL